MVTLLLGVACMKVYLCYKIIMYESMPVLHYYMYESMPVLYYLPVYMCVRMRMYNIIVRIHACKHAPGYRKYR